MTDSERLRQTLDQLGIDYTRETEEGQYSYIEQGEYDETITIERGVGYPRFHCDFYFLEGEFVNYGVWE